MYWCIIVGWLVGGGGDEAGYAIMCWVDALPRVQLAYKVSVECVLDCQRVCVRVCWLFREFIAHYSVTDSCVKPQSLPLPS